MAYITKRGSSYGVRYTYQDEQGKNCNKWESFSTKEEATNRKKQIEHELANGTFLIPSTITVKEFLMEWLPKQCNKHKWAPCTYQSNLGTVQNLIIPYIGDMQMQKLKPYHLEDLYSTLSKTPCGQYYEGKKQVLSEKQQQRFLSGTTIHEVHRLLRTAFQYAVEWGILIKSPVPVDSPKKSIQERAIWDANEMWAALASMEDPILRRRDRTPTITVRGDIADNLQSPDVSVAIMKELQPIVDSLPAGYRIDMAGSIEESGKATQAMLPLFPIMIALTLLIIILQVRSLSAMVMVFLTAPLGLIGVVPTLLIFNQPFGINALVGLIALSGILMRNTLILIGQIDHNQKDGLDPFQAVVEATVQRARPVLLTAMAAVLAFIPLTHSVFWGTLAWTLIGGTLGGTIITLVFLPAMYAIWFRIRPVEQRVQPATENV